MEDTQDEPLQLIEFIRTDRSINTTIQLKRDTIDRVFKKVGDLPISVISVCGPAREGKSFLLGYMIRCLERLEEDEEDWMDWQNKKKPLKGFKFQSGTEAETKGIWVWSRPFIVTNEDGDDIAVLLVDTQGTNDEFTTDKEMSAIIGLSLLTSSIMVFNFFDNLPEDTFSTLSTYIQYGSMVMKKEKNCTPFQKLIFLIRDWNNPGKHAYGDKGGSAFLEEKLQIKTGQTLAAKHVRKTIRTCFKDLDCYLMPSIGEKALYPEFNGSIDELAPKFAKELEKFINGLINTENLTGKEILGNAVTVFELRSCLETYVELFNSDETPSAETIWQATSLVPNNNVVERALKKYQDRMKKRMKGNKNNSYLQDEDLKRLHAAGKKQAIDLFENAKKFGTEETISEFEEKLQDKIKAEFLNFKMQNAEKRRTIITAATTQASDDFRAQLNKEFLFDGDSVFYEESKIKGASEQIKNEVIEDFQETFSDETEENLDALVQSVEEIFETILNNITNKNKGNRANVETKINLIVGEFSSSHRRQLQEYFDFNKFEEDETTLLDQHKNIVSTIVGLYGQRSKPGKEDFHKEYLIKLETELENNFFSLKNQHKQLIQDVKREAEKSIQSFYDQHMTDLREAAEEDNMDERRLSEIHWRKESSIMHKIYQLNPFPRGSPQSNDLEDKVKEQLEQVFEQVKVEVLQSSHRAAESYQKATEHALQYYKREMKEIVDSDDLIADEDLEEEHERISEEAMNEYEKFPKIGFPDNALELKHELQNSLFPAEWKRIRNDYIARWELLRSKADNCMRDCEKEYNRIMKTEVSNVRTIEELMKSHDNARAALLVQLSESIPTRDPDIIKEYEKRLSETIDEQFEELKDVFELKRTEEETATRAILADARQSYHDEMRKHFKNDLFMTPTQLKYIHEQVKKLVMEKCQKKRTLKNFQTADLERCLEDLLQIYDKKNDMYLNSEGDLGVAPAIGIDLGTTYCCIAVFYRGKVHIIPNQEQGGILTTPSYVAFNPDGSESYGAAAKDDAYKNPENTIYDAKRIIGRKMTDDELQEDMKFWPFGVQEDQGIPKVMVNGNSLHPEEISGKLLAKFRVMAENHLKLGPGTIRKAVITVPAYFNDGQRQATLDAGELAGYENVLTILNEPTAAAMAYSLERFDTDPKKILIFDLGGGTFDVAVLDMKPKEIAVLGVNGDTHLGGEDFDKKLMEFCAASFKIQTGHDLFAGKDSTAKPERDDARRRLRRLQTYCEKAKRDLASANTTRITVDAMMDGLDLTVDVTREKFEELNMPFFEKSIRLVEETLQDIGLRKEEIDDVVLVGGSSRIPKVQEMLTKFFGGKALNKSINPDTAVAYGAAVQAALMNGEQAKGQLDFSQIQDVTPMSIGVEVASKELSVIIPKNSQTPIRKKEVYYTSKDNQTSICVQIYQGEDLQVAANNKKLGEFVLSGIPPKPRQQEPIDIWMDINAMGILHVEAICRSTKGKNSVTVNENKQRMTKEAIKRILASEEANPV